MLKIGLTGGIGSGKSYVARIFESYGIPVYYADDRAKYLMFRFRPLKNSIKALFGTDSYHRNGRLNRHYIASKVFNDKKLLKQLNGLVHPAVQKDFQMWADKQNASYVLEESAIIFENNLKPHFDFVILVTADTQTRVERVIKRDKVSEESVKARIKNQLSDDKKIHLADFVIDNSKDREEDINLQVETIHLEILNLTKS